MSTPTFQVNYEPAVRLLQAREKELQINVRRFLRSELRFKENKKHLELLQAELAGIVRALLAIELQAHDDNNAESIKVQITEVT